MNDEKYRPMNVGDTVEIKWSDLRDDLKASGLPTTGVLAKVETLSNGIEYATVRFPGGLVRPLSLKLSELRRAPFGSVWIRR